MFPYSELPSPPAHINSCTVLQRLVDGFGFRFYLSTNKLSIEDYAFRPVASSMSIAEVQMHIFHLIRLSAKTLGVDLNEQYDTSSSEAVRSSILSITASGSSCLAIMKEEDLTAKTIFLKRTGETYSFWYLINGFLADALTHVGQINSWRRMSGNPVAQISPFTGASY